MDTFPSFGLIGFGRILHGYNSNFKVQWAQITVLISQTEQNV